MALTYKDSGEGKVINQDLISLLSDFRNYLLNTELRDKIVKIYLFGSYAKGEATAHSDIDIFIITSEDALIEKFLMDKIYDFLLVHPIPLEVVTSNIDELFPINDYFIYNVTHYGLEVYSMEKEQIKKEAFKSIIGLAEEYLESAEEVLGRVVLVLLLMLRITLWNFLPRALYILLKA